MTDLTQIALLAGSAVAGLAAIALTVFVCYRFADRLVGLLGASGINVMIRLSAFILLCIGIQIFWSGYSTLPGLPHPQESRVERSNSFFVIPAKAGTHEHGPRQILAPSCSAGSGSTLGTLE